MSYQHTAPSVSTGDNPSDGTPQPQNTIANPPGGRQSGNVTVYQTSGPDAYTGPIAASEGSGPALNPRSCVTCRRRKVRCDKQMPCSNCRRALIPCVFPAPGRAPRQPKPRDPNAPPKTTTSQREVELTKRLRKLEGIVEELSGQIEVESGGKGPSSASSPNSPGHPPVRRSTGPGSIPAAVVSNTVGPEGDNQIDHSINGPKKDISHRLGRLVLNDHKGNTRYVSNLFWSKLNDELDSLRKDTRRLSDGDADETDYDDTPDDSPDGTQEHLTSDDHQAFIFGYKAADVDLLTCHPPASHAPHLWATYQDRVEPILKILHVPTMDEIMKVARQTPERLSRGHEALVFAVYFSAVVAMEPGELLAEFNADKETLLRQYRFALEVALARANFLFTSELAVLQAFTLFLIVVRSVDDSRFCWTLTGLVIRIAQGMGIHRDGSQFDMTPFETEMRRRVWWAILILDLRSAEEIGSDLVITENAFDTKMPTSINDVDICPETKEMPRAREGRSDTAVALGRYEVLLMSRRFIGELPVKAIQANLAEKERVLMEAYERVEQRFINRFVDQNDPLWFLASMIARIIVSKMCLNLYQATVFAGNDSGVSGVPAQDTIRDRVFIAAIEVVEIGNRLLSDERCRRFRWLFATYTNWHAIAFNLIELGRRPWSALLERSWEAVRMNDRDPEELAKHSGHAVIFLPLRKLFFRARRHREAELLRLRSDPEAARLLDFAERTNPAIARFGPTPGNERRMDEVRLRWWDLVTVRPNDAQTSHTTNTPMTGMPLARDANNPMAMSMAPQASGAPDYQNAAAMELLDNIMAQPNPNLSTLWALGADPSHQNNLSYSSATDTPQQHVMQTGESALRRQAMALQARAASQGLGVSQDHCPSQNMWDEAWDALGPYQPSLDQGIGLNEDLDMLDGDFDWTQWTSTLATYDMGGMQGHPGQGQAAPH